MTQQLINFYAYQKRLLQDVCRFILVMFARQTGKTFTICYRIVKQCIEAEIKGQKVRWVILSRGERQAGEAMDEAIKPLIKAFYIIYKNVLKNKAEPFFYEDVFKDADGVQYKALEVRFPSGSRITALPANPDTARGYSANVYLDEFAIHKDSRKIWTALLPVVSRDGLQLIVSSTPHGKLNKFYDLWVSTEGVWSKHCTDIYQAVADGLPRDVAALKAALADNEAWAQEMELQFLEDAATWISFDLLVANESPLAGIPEKYTGGPCFVGNDIGRRRDLWVAWVWELVGDVLWTREIVTLHNATFAEQDAVLDDIDRRYNVVRYAIDQTGMGEKPVEDAKDRYGESRVEGVLFTPNNQFNMATVSKQYFEGLRARIPAGENNIRSDFQKIKKIAGANGNPRLLTERDSTSHADRAWAAFLGISAADIPVMQTDIYLGQPRQSTQLLRGYYG